MTLSINKSYGIMPNGDDVQAIELTNKNGMKVHVISYGATVTSVKIPMADHKEVDVVLGFETLEDYIQSFELPSPPYFGAIIGRYAGRIRGGSFDLNGQAIKLNPNHGEHLLHGGATGFHQKNWRIEKIKKGINSAVTLSYTSPSGEENFPGEVTVTVTYSLTESNELLVEYHATTTEDTVLNLTHHSYFNLDGHQYAVTEQELFVNAEKVIEKNHQNIPTGRVLAVAESAFDFLEAKNCPTSIDDTFVLASQEEMAASLYSLKNNLQLSVYTNQPGVHVYVGGNCFDTIPGKEGANYHPLSGICFETQNFPDAPNHDHFPSAVLKKDENYYHKTIYKFQSKSI
ncbi:aldose epimerase family protein [Flavobacterium polysaccharolyticum]|uniref:Aldose 1-epimerase n=1 Tax=Flavobacterium polysaccharolyticum TaxID=3133148 RepID=A0ABU9NMT3_9FLAO